MVTDYERAWVRLLAVIAGKPQHGREGLLTEMAKIAADCRVVPDPTATMLRLHGVTVQQQSAAVVPQGEHDNLAGSGSFGGGFDSPSDAGAADQHGPGGHDGYAERDHHHRR